MKPSRLMFIAIFFANQVLFAADAHAQIDWETVPTTPSTLQPATAPAPTDPNDHTLDELKSLKADQTPVDANDTLALSYQVLTARKGDNPGACVWQLKPRVQTDGSSISPALGITGFAGNNNSYNYTTTFFLQGAKNSPLGQPYVFDKFDVKIKNAADNTIIDTDAIANAKLFPGQVFRISLPLGAAHNLVDGISKNGLTVFARSTPEHATFNEVFPPPEPLSVKAYNDCLSQLEKDLDIWLQKFR